jgi:predicted porin
VYLFSEKVLHIAQPSIIILSAQHISSQPKFKREIHMNKKIIVAAVAAALVAPLAAMADATVYGQVRVATQYHDRDNAGDTWGMADQISLVGIKGSEDLGGGLKAIYKMEFGSNVGDGFGKSSFWNQRNSYVGLAGDWGTVLAGRHDTPHKISSGKLDFFANTAADNDNGMGPMNPRSVGLFHSLRVDGAIAYISPNMAGFTLAGAVVQTNTAATFDDGDDFASAYSLAAMYSNGPWFASAAYESLDPESLAGAAGAPDDEKYRLGIGVLGMAGFSAGFVYESRDNAGFVDGLDTEAWQLSAAYDFGNNRVKAMYGSYDADGAGDFDTWAIGLQHNFSKRTDAEVLYRAKDADSDVGIDDNVFALQLNHKF